MHVVASRGSPLAARSALLLALVAAAISSAEDSLRSDVKVMAAQVDEVINSSNVNIEVPIRQLGQSISRQPNDARLLLLAEHLYSGGGSKSDQLISVLSRSAASSPAPVQGVIPLLTKLFPSEGLMNQYKILEILFAAVSRQSPDTEGFLRSVVSPNSNHRSDIRSMAAAVLIKGHPSDSAARKVLLGQIRSKHTSDQVNAANACSLLRSDAGFARPALVANMQSASLPVRVVSAAAVWSISGQAKDILPVLRQALTDNSSVFTVRPMYSGEASMAPTPARYAAATILEMKQAAAPLIDDVVNELHTDDELLQILCIRAIGAMRPSAIRARAPLEELKRRSTSPVIQDELARALTTLTTSPNPKNQAIK